MKKILTFAGIAILSATAFVSCTKKSSSSPSYPMTATINGQSFSGTSIANTASSLLVIDGASSFSTSTPQYPYLTLSVTGYNGTTGTFNIDGVSANAGIDSSATVATAAAYGTVTITSVSSSTIAGTFSYTCYDSTKVSNGSFSAKVQ